MISHQGRQESLPHILRQLLVDDVITRDATHRPDNLTECGYTRRTSKSPFSFWTAYPLCNTRALYFRSWLWHAQRQL
ncbi:hypothetical protein BJX76DRAFT_329180 [Aspergillus varians]